MVSERTSPSVNENVSFTWRVLRRICYPMADLVVAQTQDAARWIEAKCRAKVVVIPNALRLLPHVNRRREPLIIAAGRLSQEKGFDLLLSAFAKIAADFTDWRLCIIGHGPEFAALSELRERLQLTSRTEIVGHVSDIEAWMARASLLVHPSRREGFPNVVLEAMGMGAAVICADCRSGPAELIKHDVNGYLVPVDDLDALVAAMTRLMSSPDIRDRLGTEAVMVRWEYAQETIYGKWEKCLLPYTTARH